MEIVRNLKEDSVDYLFLSNSNFIDFIHGFLVIVSNSLISLGYLLNIKIFT